MSRMESVRGPESGRVGFSEQTDTYLRRVLMDRVYANDDVLFTKTFKPPKSANFDEFGNQKVAPLKESEVIYKTPQKLHTHFMRFS